MMQNLNRLQIGEVAKESGASIDTIRYYEKLGLLARPIRSEGGFRLYSKETIEKLRFVKNAQKLGFTLNEIQDVMRCSRTGLKPCCDLVKELLEKKLSTFESKIKELQKMRRNLKSLLAEWVPPRKAKNRMYAVCPQIERTPRKTRGGRKNGKAKG